MWKSTSSKKKENRSWYSKFLLITPSFFLGDLYIEKKQRKVAQALRREEQEERYERSP